MGLLSSAERQRLGALLLQLPNVGLMLPMVRAQLLADMPPAVVNNAPYSGIVNLDLPALVQTADGPAAQLADGSWPIPMLIENAMRLVPDTRLALDLEGLLNGAMARGAALLQAGVQLEALVNTAAGFANAEHWIERLSAAVRAVCRVEGAKTGTGFLVGPDLVLTNYHVVDQELAGAAQLGAVTLRFDYRVDTRGNVRPGVAYGVKAEVLPASTFDQLDFALLRAVGRPGDDPSGGVSGAPARGWLEPGEHPAQAGRPLFVIQHPQGKPLKLAIDSVQSVGDTRVRYSVNTSPGSSGSPCLDERLELVALHHAGDLADPPTFNEGVLIAAILDAPNVQALLGP
jgi:hypothetical protein